MGTLRGTPCLDLSASLASLPGEAAPKEVKARRTSRGSRDVSHEDRHQAGASARNVLVSSLVLRRQAQARTNFSQDKCTRCSPSKWPIVAALPPHEVPVTQAVTTKGARRAPACAESLFPLWCKGSKRRQEHQAKAAISVQQDQGRKDRKTEVIVEPKTASPPELYAGEDYFCQDSLY